MTGHKAIDQLIQRYGVMLSPGEDSFQRFLYLTGGDKKANHLPFCMFQKVMEKPLSYQFTVHHFYLPNKKGRLASFLFDEKGVLVEQVYYVKLARLIQVCKKLQRLVIQKRTNEDTRHYLAA